MDLSAFELAVRHDLILQCTHCPDIFKKTCGCGKYNVQRIAHIKNLYFVYVTGKKGSSTWICGARMSTKSGEMLLLFKMCRLGR